MQDSEGINYPQESILTGESAYEFLSNLKNSESKQVNTWIEFPYKNYNHGKLLIKNAREELGNGFTLADGLICRLDRYRKELINDNDELEKYIEEQKNLGNEEIKEKILEQVTNESEIFKDCMKEFQIEEVEYMEENKN